MGAMLFGLRILFILTAVVVVVMEVLVFGGGLLMVAQMQRVLDAPPYRVDHGRVAPTAARLPRPAPRNPVLLEPGRNGVGDHRGLPVPAPTVVEHRDEVERLLAA